MEQASDLKALLESARTMAKKNEKTVNEQMSTFLNDKFSNQEDKDFINLMKNKIDQGIKNGDSNAIHSVISELTNKIHK